MTRAEWEAKNWRSIMLAQTGELIKIGAHVAIVENRERSEIPEFSVVAASDREYWIDTFPTHREAMEFCRDMKFIVEF